MEEFKVKAFTKKELALQYFPQSHPRTAVNRLMSWIKYCTPLWQKLLEGGYRKTSKSFSPREVKLIADHLGEP